MKFVQPSSVRKLDEKRNSEFATACSPRQVLSGESALFLFS
jgi:hypothetical protein